MSRAARSTIAVGTEVCDARQILANRAGVDLTRINGLGLAATIKIVSETGPDLSRFANVKHPLLTGAVSGQSKT
jgi:hypothetical protein